MELFKIILFIILGDFLCDVSTRSLDERHIAVQQIIDDSSCSGTKRPDDTNCKYGSYNNKCGIITCFQGPGEECNELKLCNKSLICSCNKCLGTHPITKEGFHRSSASECSQNLEKTKADNLKHKANRTF